MIVQFSLYNGNGYIFALSHCAIGFRPLILRNRSVIDYYIPDARIYMSFKSALKMERQKSLVSCKEASSESTSPPSYTTATATSRTS